MTATDRQSISSAPAVLADPPELRATNFEDFSEIHRLEAEFFSELYTPDDRRRMFEDNPLWPRLAGGWPLGWVLEDSSGVIVGSVGNIPSLYLYRGEEKICANGHSWVVASEHRGYAPLLMDEYFQQDGADLVISSRVGVDAAPLWRSYGLQVPVGDWSRMAYMATDRRVLARTALAMKGVPFRRALSGPAAAALKLRERFTTTSLSPLPDGFELGESRVFDERFDEFWEELRSRKKEMLLAVRDRATLEWRFGIALRAGRLWIHEARRNGRMRAYCVLRSHHHRPAAHRTQALHGMRLVDYQTLEDSVDLLPGLLRSAISRCVADGYSLLEHNACDLPKMRSFDASAPYRQAKPTWSLYVGTTDPALASELTSPEVWDPSEYDGEPSYM
jgi:hypothetical protein